MTQGRFTFALPVALAFLLSTFVFAPAAHAGILELGYSFSRTESSIDEDNYSKSLSHTASLSWYFLEMSAIELSYTKGEGQVSGKASGETDPIRYRTELELYGADLVLTLAQKDWTFQPYVKGGMVWVDKKIFRKSDVDITETLITKTDKDDPVPSMGAGIRILITKAISIKASYERWRSGKSGDTETWDSTMRAGVSFYF